MPISLPEPPPRGGPNPTRAPSGPNGPSYARPGGPNRPNSTRPAAKAEPALPPKPAPYVPGAPGGIERRRRPRTGFDHWIHTPVSDQSLERTWRHASRGAVLVGVAVVLTVVGLVAFRQWSRRLVVLSPRHRPEALCYALATPPEFTPPMRVEPSAAMVPGRFPVGTPPALALRQTMRLSDDMVLSEQSRTVGDFRVASLWLRLPGEGEGQHWLIVAWMEGADLAVCNFRFSGRTDDLSAEEIAWGDRLLGRILEPEYFQSGTVPSVVLRARHDGALPTFGPKDG